EGFLHPHRVSGGAAETTVVFICRDFDDARLREHEQLIRDLAAEIERREPRARVTVEVERSYRNMKEFLDARPRIVEAADEATRRPGTGAERKPRRNRRSRVERARPAHAEHLHGRQRVPLGPRVDLRAGHGRFGRDGGRAREAVGRAGLGGKLTGYSAYAQFYDATQGERTEHAAYIRSLLKKHHPRATTVLELACGTGSILKQLQPHYHLTGVDLSDEMLAIARKKLPGVRLLQGDMRAVDLGERFDVVLCVYDSINHLTRFRDWDAVFRRAREHLNDGGVFLFDINTVHRLASSSGAPPMVQWFGDGSLMVIAIVEAPRGAVDWEINVFERVRGSSYRLHLHLIRQVPFPTAPINSAPLNP